jgi:hypothetical protein
MAERAEGRRAAVSSTPPVSAPAAAIDQKKSGGFWV